MKNTLYLKIYNIVKLIPYGRVTSYGQIARLLGDVRLSRVVGYALSKCDDQNVPCHRVINSTGKLASSFGEIGNIEQKLMLMKEKITFKDDCYVNIEKHFWPNEEELNLMSFKRIF